MIATLRGAAVLFGLGAALGASAITFSNITASVPYNVTLIGTDAFTIQVPSNIQYGPGATTVNFTWNVAADSGYVLTGIYLVPNGLTSGGGSMSLVANHPGDATAQMSQQTQATTQYPNSFTALTNNKVSFAVTAQSILIGTDTPGIAKMSALSVIYRQQPVPEPATIVALALGAAGIARRRGGRK